MNSKKPRYYYHVTEQKWSDKVILTPKIDGPNRDINEPKTPRICVCPTIEQCFVAIYFKDDPKWYIYRTEKKEIATYSRNISDSYITGEQWLRKKTIFIKIGSITTSQLLTKEIQPIEDESWYCLGDGGKESERWQKKAVKVLKKNKLIKKMYKELR